MGDGTGTPGLYRQSDGYVYFRSTHAQGIADSQTIYGNPGDRLDVGDWNGDGTDSPALFRPSDTMVCFCYADNQGIADARYSSGGPGWLPVAGDFGPS